MLKMTVKDLENDRTEVRFGDELSLAAFLRDRYPHDLNTTSFDLDAEVGYLNASDLFEVKVEPFEQGIEQNRLPEDYLTAEQGEDPWVRAGEKDVI